MSKSEISWDLSEIFPSTTDSLVQKAIDDVTAIAERFANRYRGKIKDFSAKELLTCIQDYEIYFAKLEGISLFAGLSFFANMTLAETQSLNDKASKLKAKVGKLAAFFELEVGNLVYENPRLISDPALADYRHSLERLQRQVPHQLSEVEEKLIIEKDQFGVRAWEELQSKWLNTRMFEVMVEGEKKVVPFGEAYGLVPHPDRATRESAMRSICVVVGKDGEIFCSALRNICNDWLNVCERRKYDSPMHASLIANDVEQHIIDDLVGSIEDNAGLYQRYLLLKAEIMGLPRLGCQDVVAPLPDAPVMKFSFDAAKDLVVRAYSKFDEDYAFAVKDMFARNHVDASPRFGKHNGSFCSRWYNGKSAFVLQNFNGNLNDVYTLAHELGHATHDYYFSRNQSIANGKIPMVVAETASIFGELLLTDLLLSETKTDVEKKAILCRVLDVAGSMLFRVTARFWFERSLYNAIRRGEFLDHKTVCRFWVAARDKAFGDAVDWFDELEAEWSVVPLNFMANFRFYNYPYVYGQLFVYALYQKYVEEGRAFVPKLKKILSAGSTLSPVEIGRIAGFDVGSAGFWKVGMKQFEHFVEALEKIAK